MVLNHAKRKFSPFEPYHVMGIQVKGRNGEKLSIIEQLDESRKVMGYCPQFDGIQPNMTGREQLEFYAMIRGVPSEDVKSTADELLKKMDLTKYADRQVCACERVF